MPGMFLHRPTRIVAPRQHVNGQRAESILKSGGRAAQPLHDVRVQLAGQGERKLACEPGNKHKRVYDGTVTPNCFLSAATCAVALCSTLALNNSMKLSKL